MTPKERAAPKSLDLSRKKRIARGSGTQLEEVNKLLKQFEDMRKVMGMMNKEKGSRRIPMPGMRRR
jgi:signal recognition particle subunit SRP54